MAIDSDTEAHVTADIDAGGVAWITFFHPAQNAMPGYLLEKLASVIERMGEAPEARVIVLQSGGDRAFCAGASFDELVAIQDEEAGFAFFSGFAHVINACRKSPKLIIGRVQGAAVGGGVGLAAAVDYCLATKYARIRLSELAIGIGPFVVGPAIERKIGVAAFSQLTLEPTQFQAAQWAYEKGLYQQVYESADELFHAIEAYAGRLSNYSPAAMRQIKAMLWRGTEDWDTLLAERARTSGRLALSEETKQAIQAFKQRMK